MKQKIKYTIHTFKTTSPQNQVINFPQEEWQDASTSQQSNFRNSSQSSDEFSSRFATTAS